MCGGEPFYTDEIAANETDVIVIVWVRMPTCMNRLMMGFLGRSRRMGHNIRITFFRTECQCGRAVGNQVQPEQLYGGQGGVFRDERPQER